MDWAKTTTRRDETRLSCRIWFTLRYKFDDISESLPNNMTSIQRCGRASVPDIQAEQFGSISRNFSHIVIVVLLDINPILTNLPAYLGA